MLDLLNRSKKTVFALALLCALVFGGLLGTSDATAASGSNCTYYSDSSYTTVVGQFGYDCCNNPVAWGVKTAYSRCSQACFICYPPPRD